MIRKKHPGPLLGDHPVGRLDYILTEIVGGTDEYVDGDLRRATVVALTALGRSEDWRDRADAGHSLAGFAEMQEAVGPLLGLVLDPGDTFVTQRTAEGLLRRKDRAGLAIVASAMAVADDNHADYLHTAVVRVFSIFSDDLDEALRLCEEMSGDNDDLVARGSRRLHESLAEIDPVLRPS
ncbi:hypothetical protein ABZS61_07420 [Streptomyces sp. NPDC005566]|uniref:hypothetical protein n=1 Tax=Streptomyces sp. NPDC005566 TaxID=3156886 RepID=UPI00339F487E